MVPLHSVIEPELRTWLLERTLERLALGEGPRRAQYEVVRGECVRAGGSSLYAGAESESRRYFADSAKYAELALAQPEGSDAVRATDIAIGVDPATIKTEVEGTPINTGCGEARMSVVEYEAGLYTLWAFGSETALRDAARIPEKDYRSSGIVQSEANWRATEAEKLLALGEERTALDIYETIVDGDTLPVYRERIEGIRLLVSGSQKEFLQSLAKLLALHRAKAAKRPADMAGLVCFPGMIAARLALRRGLVVEDQNYLPLRFMPGHPANPAGCDQMKGKEVR